MGVGGVRGGGDLLNKVLTLIKAGQKLNFGKVPNHPEFNSVFLFYEMWYLNIHRWLSLIEIDIKSTQIPAKLLRGGGEPHINFQYPKIFFGALVPALTSRPRSSQADGWCQIQ